MLTTRIVRVRLLSVFTTDLDPDEYIDSLTMFDVEPEAVYALAGASLIKVSEDHYLVLMCAEHDHGERDQQMLLRLLPQEWSAFHSVENPEQGFQVHHYGPED
jgi:hypothetical protein